MDVDLKLDWNGHKPSAAAMRQALEQDPILNIFLNAIEAAANRLLRDAENAKEDHDKVQLVTKAGAVRTNGRPLFNFLVAKVEQARQIETAKEKEKHDDQSQ